MTAFHIVAKTGDIQSGIGHPVEINDHEILLTMLGDNYLAVENICTCIAPVVGHHCDHDEDDPHTHGGRLARLSEGTMDGGRVTCPMHGSVYDLRTGRPVSGGAETSLNTYEVQVEGDQVKVAELADCERHFQNDEGAEDRP